MFVYIELHYSTTVKSQKNFVINYHVISDYIGKWQKGTPNYSTVFNGTSAIYSCLVLTTDLPLARKNSTFKPAFVSEKFYPISDTLLFTFSMI
jgi:hypothetical protein